MRNRILTVLVFVMILTVPALLLRAYADPQERPVDPVVLKWDEGPDKVDISKYPANVKKGYKVFADLCARCHPLARAINCDFVLADDWERYIKRMMRRGGTLIKPDDALQIFEFVVYDSKIRKKELYERRLAGAR